MSVRNVPNIDIYVGGEARMGNLWENKQGYINNAAILYTDKVTPLRFGCIQLGIGLVFLLCRELFFNA
ncbi:hypothetical protein ACE38W_01890 [Chitinophaga sp. Hz27]|uniref:hypothetical protein n=1 Tax=Chitinophaga sp. Hz27 TaxID=3347169 RepID=UPI0035DD6CC3